MPQSHNIDNTKVATGTKQPDEGVTTKENYTAIRYGNEKGSISFGTIDKQAEVTSGVKLQGANANVDPAGPHSFNLEIDGERKGWTSSVGPGNFQVECGSGNAEEQDSLILNAKNGNIMITATNGKIRMQGTDIEIIAIGDKGDGGNIKIDATETIRVESKKYINNAKMMYQIFSPQRGEILSNGVLKIYGGMVRGITAACSKKDSKVGGKRLLQLWNRLTT